MPAGDRERFVSLFDAHFTAVLAYAARRSDPDTAQEVAAETFLVAWRRLQDVPGHALPWLLVVARNTLSSSRRSEYRRRVLETEAAWMDTLRPGPDVADAAASRSDVLVALARLSPADRETLMLVAWDGLGARDAARVVGCSPATFSVRLHRARRRLDALLDDPDEPHASPVTCEPTVTRPKNPAEPTSGATR